MSMHYSTHAHTHTCAVALEVNIVSSDVMGARFVFVGRRATFTATPSSTIASVSGSLRTHVILSFARTQTSSS